MGFRFRRGIRVGPARVNIGKRGVSSVSFGRRGLRTNLSRRGVGHSIGIPGTGVSYSTKGGGCGCCLSRAVIVGAVALALPLGITALARMLRSRKPAAS